MKQDKHTPGPWSIRKSACGNYNITTSHDMLVALESIADQYAPKEDLLINNIARSAIKKAKGESND